MIEYKVGDLLATTDPFIAHGCNSYGKMGAGVALQIAKRYPWVAEKLRTTYEWHVGFKTFQGGLPAGEVYEYAQRDAPYRILNIITQVTYGRKGKHVSYDALDKAFASVKGIVNGQPLSIPRIGAGLGGGAWPIVEAIINHHIKSPVTVWDLE